jgi:hypothetical protein
MQLATTPAHSPHSQTSHQKIRLPISSAPTPQKTKGNHTQTIRKILLAAHEVNDSSIIMRHKPTITPSTLLIELTILPWQAYKTRLTILSRSHCPTPIPITWLKKPRLSCCRFNRLFHPKIPPPSRSSNVLFVHAPVSFFACKESDAKVVVGVFYRAGDSAMRYILAAMSVICFEGDVAVFIVICNVTASFYAPIRWFDFCVLKMSAICHEGKKLYCGKMGGWGRTFRIASKACCQGTFWIPFM